MAIDVQPIILEGATVRLEPVESSHAPSLARYADPAIFRFFASLQPSGTDEKAVADFISASQELRNVLSFAICLAKSGEAIGMTSYMDIRAEHDGLEIGFTWIGRPYQGTKVNPECKFLLLRHAFEVLGCERVQLKTDARNLQSQAALRKLGATYEGTLRKHIRMLDGYMRDTVMFSIVRSEWPLVKEHLLERLAS